MPILDLGYRPWNGNRTSKSMRWSVVARSGIMLVWRGTWLKRILMFATIPSLIAMLGFGIFEQSVKDETYRMIFNNFMSQVAAKGQQTRPVDPDSPQDIEPSRNSRVRGMRPRRPREFKELISDPPNQRHLAWSNILLWYFRYPQAFWIVAVVGLVAPRLISYDLRSRGYLLYLSRPLSPTSYVLGKACVLFFLLAMITTVPALILYIGGLLLSNDITAIVQTWDIPFRIVLATAVLVLPTSAVALAFSSMTQESRFAAFGWFAMWVVGWVTYLVLTGTSMLDETDMIELQRRWLLISPYHVLGHLQQEIFGLISPDDHRIGPWLICGVATFLGFFIAHWRVARMLKA